MHPGVPALEDLDGAQRYLDKIFPVSRETVEKLAAYGRLLAQWQAKTNLVATGEINSFWSRHVADSLQCVALAGLAEKWIDLGSGGGFPGMVAAIVLEETECHLVESNRKKCAFLRAVAVQCDCQAKIHAGRIESVAERLRQETAFDIVSARALAPLPKLLGLAAPFLMADAVAYFHKGRDYMREIEDSRGLWHYDLVVHDSRIAADSVILEIRNLRPLRQGTA